LEFVGVNFGAEAYSPALLAKVEKDTIEANEKLGYGSDLRDYGMGAQMLYDLGIRKIRLLTNNPKKVIGLEGYGLEIVEQAPIRLPSNPHNEKYLETKRTRMGHHL
jgi:3,4-dihydroxy 2-butanone 4-phosphate synthase/GTP cyclohydrolase II